MASGSPWLALGGAQKANRNLAAALTSAHHEVHVIALARAGFGGGLEQFRARVEQLGLACEHGTLADHVTAPGVDVTAVHDTFDIEKVMADKVARLAPEVAIVSSEDWRQLVLQGLFDAGFDGPIVYQARTLTSLPFGPLSAEPLASGAALVRRCVCVTPCAFYAEYIREHLRVGVEPRVIYNTFHEQMDAPRLGSFDNPFITLINPCPLKGSTIFLGLARALPDLRWAAVPSWGTTNDVLASLEEARVHVMPPDPDIEKILRQTKILLVPSLWPEGLANVVIEAMLRGVPVLMADHGGLREAPDGGLPRIPVRPIERLATLRSMPVALEVAEQELGRWIDAIRGLTADRGTYDAASEAARSGARSFAAQTSADGYLALLEELAARPVASTRS